MRIRILLIVILSAVSSFAQSTCNQLTRQALELYGCIDSLKGFPKQMESQIASQFAQDQSLTPADKEKLAETMIKSLSVERLIANVTKQAALGCDPEGMRKVVRVLRTPLVQKMRRFEAQTSSPEFAERFQKYLNSPEVQTPPEKRAALVDQLITATGVREVMVDSIIATAGGMLKGLGAPLQSQEQIEEMRQQIESNAGQQVNLMMLTVYHDASDQELQDYVAALSAKEFKAFSDAYAKALVNGISEESRNAGLALRAVLAEKAAQQKPAPAPSK
ncbi:MAG TPA: hypothetical protein VN577_15295 [Terriglobales bacterium]|nr:hypothetical protein [Terriglobales bacterium]